jgi:hypothetical protein
MLDFGTTLLVVKFVPIKGSEYILIFRVIIFDFQISLMRYWSNYLQQSSPIEGLGMLEDSTKLAVMPVKG